MAKLTEPQRDELEYFARANKRFAGQFWLPSAPPRMRTVAALRRAGLLEASRQGGNYDLSRITMAGDYLLSGQAA